MFPIHASNQAWYLDKAAANPVLRVKRRQIPLVPIFCRTAHAAQGMNLPKVWIDILLGPDSSGQGIYVAASRVPSRESVYILRPFPRDLFKRMRPLGPTL